MKRLTVVILTLLLVFTTPALAATTASSDFEISAYEFVGYECSESSLTSQETIDYGILLNSSALASNTGLSVNGKVRKEFSVEVQLANGKVINAVDKTSNYSVLSILNAGTYIRLVLKEVGQKNIVYVKIAGYFPVAFDSYNGNWYTNFITAEVAESVSLLASASPDTDHRTFVSTSEVFNETIVETLTLKYLYTWPYSMNDSTGGHFTAKLSIDEKYTTYTHSDNTTTTLSYNSLYVTYAKFKAVTPKGEYIRYVDIDPNAEDVKMGSIYVDFSIGIPKTPLSIGATLPQRVYYNNDYRFSFDYDETDGAAMGICIAFDGNLVNKGQYFDADVTVLTDRAYEVLGSKLFTIKWDYRVVSNGNVSNIEVDYYCVDDVVTKTLLYTLTSA